METQFLTISIQEFNKYKGLGDKAMAQLRNTEEMHWKPGVESNSMAVIIRHLYGNMLSRWTNFLTTDGEKPTRDRDNEFEETRESRAELIEKWEAGWKCVFEALGALKEEDLQQTVYIRNEAHSVMQAVIRQMFHYAGHIGQMIYLAKQIRDAEWSSLSIPRNKSSDFNRQMGM